MQRILQQLQGLSHCMQGKKDFVTLNRTTNIKKDTANTHGKSKSHIAAFQALTTPSPEVSDTVQCLQRLNDRTKEKMCKLFDIAYTVAHSEQPFRLFRTLVGLEKAWCGAWIAYQNSKACRLFIEHIAGTMKDQLHDLPDTCDAQGILKAVTQNQKLRQLKDLGEALEEHVLKPTRAQGTRWINHRRKALVALAANYRSLSVHLLQGADEPGQDKSN
ncbi:hypothetical protein F7725_009659 [Dissostichus mawsoni]|uniref:Uncharacterized protein n=1 Tax=Dissostichus mawsoni TaxID=36200 RepID=A0A7J5XLQ1_DISMA|nr:hypothetical protein F7725_009659 [Dissostichus mawsoni]